MRGLRISTTAGMLGAVVLVSLSVSAKSQTPPGAQTNNGCPRGGVKVNGWCNFKFNGESIMVDQGRAHEFKQHVDAIIQGYKVNK
jgi:hypothetical protein